MRTLVAAGVAAALVLSACRGGDDGGASPTVPTASTTTTTLPDVSVIPQVIDEAYLNGVLAALDDVYGEAVRIIVETKRFPPEAADRLNAVYGDEEFEHEANTWVQSLARDPELRNFRPEPGNRKTKVERIIAASPSCVWMAVRRDRSASNFDPGPDRIEYVALRPLDRSNDPKGVNPTRWMITTEGYRADGSQPDNPCASS